MSLADRLRADPAAVTALIEHTNVDPASTRADVQTLCEEVREYDLRAAVVVPYHAARAADLVGDAANVVAVVGFPYGTQSTAAKRQEVRDVRPHVDEVDVVMNRAAFACGDDETVREDISAVVGAAGDRTVKCIIESPALSTPEIQRAAELVAAAGADFVKTAVGYDGPTDPAEVRAIREAVGDETAIKASGGIGSYEAALAVVEAGATRIGASSGVDICKSAKRAAE